MAAIGLPYTLRSGSVELLVAVSKAHAEAFKKYRINWRNYLHGVHDEIASLQITDAQKAAELAILASWRGVVPRTAYFGFLIERLAKAAIAAVRLPARTTMSTAEGAPEPRRGHPSDSPPAWDDFHYSKAIQVQNIDQAVSLLQFNGDLIDQGSTAG
jgi:hypothetical protein